jgi:probable HAF family extracellular repeat protein
MTVCRTWSLAVVSLASLLLLIPGGRPRAQSLPGPYVLTDLGTFGTIQSAAANDINDAGQVVGYAAARAFIWQNGQKRELSTSGSMANAVNSLGQAVGSARIVAGGQPRAVLWDNGAQIDLVPEQASNENASVNGINDSRQIVGVTNYWAGFIWNNGVRTSLGNLGGGGSFPSDINNAGQVVGSSYSTVQTALGPMQHPFLWQGGIMNDLGLLPGDEDGGATAINTHGHIVGSSGRTDPDTYETAYRPFLYKDGAMTQIPAPSVDAYAGDINDHGVVVGTMRAGNAVSKWHAWIYADGVVTNLNSRIPAGSGLHLAYAVGINNAGQIVGTAFDSRGSYHAFLLTPAAAGTPVVNIGDASVIEGHSGTRSATLAVTLSAAASAPISVSYSMANGGAVAGSDYQSASGTVTFAAGEASKTVAVLVNGDRAGEADETFSVNVGLSNGNAVLGDAQGIVTIVDDEPRMNITSVTKSEGQSGNTPFTFTVSLATASTAAVSVNFATADGSAKAAEDYEARTGSLMFNAGETSKTVTVNVKGDRKVEFQEVFYVNLSGASGAFLASNQGTGVVRNDDR